MPWRSIAWIIALRKAGFSVQIGSRPGAAHRFTLSMPVADESVKPSVEPICSRCCGGTRSMTSALPSRSAASRVSGSWMNSQVSPAIAGGPCQ